MNYGRFRYADTLLKKHNEETQKIIDKHKKILEAKDEDILKVRAWYYLHV